MLSPSQTLFSLLAKEPTCCVLTQFPEYAPTFRLVLEIPSVNFDLIVRSHTIVNESVKGPRMSFCSLRPSRVSPWPLYAYWTLPQLGLLVIHAVRIKLQRLGPLMFVNTNQWCGFLFWDGVGRPFHSPLLSSFQDGASIPQPYRGLDPINAICHLLADYSFTTTLWGVFYGPYNWSWIALSWHSQCIMLSIG